MYSRNSLDGRGEIPAHPWIVIANAQSSPALVQSSPGWPQHWAHDLRQRPAGTMNCSWHLPHLTCCVQLYGPSGGTSEQPLLASNVPHLPQLFRQRPAGTMDCSWHLPHLTCCAQLYRPSGSTSEQLPPSLLPPMPAPPLFPSPPPHEPDCRQFAPPSARNRRATQLVAGTQAVQRPPLPESSGGELAHLAPHVGVLPGQRCCAILAILDGVAPAASSIQERVAGVHDLQGHEPGVSHLHRTEQASQTRCRPAAQTCQRSVQA